jgi:hypothetical protein
MPSLTFAHSPHLHVHHPLYITLVIILIYDLTHTVKSIIIPTTVSPEVRVVFRVRITQKTSKDAASHIFASRHIGDGLTDRTWAG